MVQKRSALKWEKLKGPVWNAAGSTMFGLNSMLLLVLVSRVCGVETAGVFSLAFSTAQLLYYVGLFGAEHYQMTDYAQKYSFAAYKKLKLLTTLLAIVCCAAAVLVLGFSAEAVALTFILMLYMQWHSVGSLYQSLQFRLNRLDLAGCARFSRTLIALIFFGTSLVLTRNVYAASLLLLLGCFLAFWRWPWWSARPMVERTRGVQSAELWELIKECMPMFLIQFLSNLMLNLPRYAIEQFWNDGVQGIFGMVFMPAQVINLLSIYLYMPMLKHISEVADRRDTKQLFSIMGRQTLLVLGFTAVCTLGAVLLGPEVLGWLYSTNLGDYRLALALVVVGGGMFACSQLLYFVLVILRQQNSLFVSYIIGCVLGALTSLLLVKPFGALGAACAFAAAHVLLSLVLLATLVQRWRRLIHA